MAAGIIFAYANDNGQSLNFLEREIDEAYEYINRMDKDIANPVKLKDVSVHELFNEVNNRKQELKIFHFSGHAGQLNLMFAGETIINGTGIAALIEAVADLDLVFLNACATRDLIPALHKSGVKTVIASSRKVFDSMAAEFSILFYTSLSQFATIGESFDYARSYFLSLNKKEIVGEGSARHINTEKPRAGDEEEFPYGIYHNPRFPGGNLIDELAGSEGWRLGNVDEEYDGPRYNPAIQLLKAIGSKGNLLAEQLALQTPTAAINAEINEFGQLDNKYQTFELGAQNLVTAKELYEKTESLLPQPLGEVIRQIMSTAKDIGSKEDKPYKDLLAYLLRFYEILVKLSCFTMLSDLYEVLQKKSLKNEPIQFDPDVRHRIMALLSMDRKNAIEFNYRDLIRDMRDMILLNDGEPFVDEYNIGHAGQDSVRVDVSHGIIKWQKTMSQGKAVRGGYIRQCRKVEEELCTIFDEVYFILRYNLLVIRNVEAVRIRFNPNRSFDHWVMLLRLGQASTYQSCELQNVTEYTENYSVILVRGMSRIIDYLSLSPFIIDKGVLTVGEDSDLFYFSHVKGNILVYEAVQDEKRKMEIEITKKEIRRWEGSDRKVQVIPYVPFVDTLDKANVKLDVRKVTARLMNIHEQFQFFKKEIAKLTAPAEQPHYQNP